MKRILKTVKREYNYISSHQHRILFDHLPKCGGTTIIDNLIMNFPNRHIYQMNGLNPETSVKEFKILPDEIRWKYKLIFGHLANELRDYVHPDTICTTVFREPIDRIVSHYYYVKVKTSHYLHEKVINEKIGLLDYCRLNLSEELSNYYITHFTQMSLSEIEKNPEQSVALALKNILKNYHLIGFQNNIPAFLDSLERVGNFEFTSKQAVKNKTMNRVKTREIDLKAKKEIERNNSLDLMLYDELIARKKSGVIKTI